MTRRLAEVVYTEAKTYCRGLERERSVGTLTRKVVVGLVWLYPLNGNTGLPWKVKEREDECQLYACNPM